jgi:hypothetical protein
MHHQTPYDDSYATCESTYAKLLIYPGDTDPHIVSDRLGLQPSRINRVGETRTNSLGRTRTITVNGWFLSSEGEVCSKDTRRHLDWLLDELAPRASRLKELQALPGMRMSVRCSWWSAHGHGGPALWPRQLRMLADLDLELSFDIYFVDAIDQIFA